MGPASTTALVTAQADAFGVAMLAVLGVLIVITFGFLAYKVAVRKAKGAAK